MAFGGLSRLSWWTRGARPAFPFFGFFRRLSRPLLVKGLPHGYRRPKTPPPKFDKSWCQVLCQHRCRLSRAARSTADTFEQRYILILCCGSEFINNCGHCSSCVGTVAQHQTTAKQAASANTASRRVPAIVVAHVASAPHGNALKNEQNPDPRGGRGARPRR